MKLHAEGYRAAWHGKGAKSYQVIVGETILADDCRTASEAIATAEQAIVQVFTGNYIPIVLTAGNVTGIAYRTPLGWMYQIGEGLRGEVRECQLTTYLTRHECERRLRSHMAQWTQERTLLQHPGDIADFDRHQLWQAEYRKLTAQGMSDNDARHAAFDLAYA